MRVTVSVVGGDESGVVVVDEPEMLTAPVSVDEEVAEVEGASAAEPPATSPLAGTPSSAEDVGSGSLKCCLKGFLVLNCSSRWRKFRIPTSSASTAG
jgi:hypothetical protein